MIATDTIPAVAYLRRSTDKQEQSLGDQRSEIERFDDDWEETDDTYVAVVDSTDETMVVRLTAGAADPSTAWFLSLRIREQMIAWLQEYEDGRYLPRQRVKLVEQPGADASRRSGENGVDDPSISGRPGRTQSAATRPNDGGDGGDQ